MTVVDMRYSIIRVVFEFPPIIGGSVTHITELSKAINPFLRQQIILAPAFGGHKEFDTKFPIPIIRSPYTRFLSFGDFAVPSPILFSYAHTVVRKINDLLKEHPIDIVHVHGPMLGAFIKFFMGLFDLHTPLVIMQHGYGVERSVGHAISRWLTGILVSLFPPDYFLLLDDGTQIENVERFLNRRQIPYKIVLHGINADFFRCEESQKEDRRFAILFPHRPERVKRPDLALQIFKRFLRMTKQRDIRLILLASRDAKDLKKIAAKNSVRQYVEFAEKQDVLGVKGYMDSSDVVIGTSLESNMNRAIEEAMACGKPTVVFDSGGTSRLIRHKVNGVLIKLGDVESFAKELKLLYDNPTLREKLGKNGRETIVKDRSWEARVKKELTVYREVMSS